MTLLPRRITPSNLGRGMRMICSYQFDMVSVKLRISSNRRTITGSMLGSVFAAVAQSCSAAKAGSTSRSLRTAAILAAMVHTSVSASKKSRRSPRTGTRRMSPQV